MINSRKLGDTARPRFATANAIATMTIRTLELGCANVITNVAPTRAPTESRAPRATVVPGEGLRTCSAFPSDGG